MFDSLSQRFQSMFKQLRSRGRLGPKEIEAALRDIRRSFLEADAPYRIIQDFLERVKIKALGNEVLQSITPAQQIQKIVHEELTLLLGGQYESLKIPHQSTPAIMMLVGLQGAGKTTTCAKLAQYYQKNGYKPFLLPADLKRAAAVNQLISLAKKVGCAYFDSPTSNDTIELCQEGIRSAAQSGANLVIIDTAGRNHIDETLMSELDALKKATQPDYTLLVLDAMTGQDAIKSTTSFHEHIHINGAILTKLDGDARGGAAISLKAATGQPILFAGTGEDINGLEPFHPDRMASRILAMGDVLTLVERAQESLKANQIQTLTKDKFDFEDLLEQVKQMTKLGPLDDLLPKTGIFRQTQVKSDEKSLPRMQAIIESMTPKERKHPEIINGSRRNRISKGSGTTIQE
ncbi:MAG: signal recognition particle protein, partial [Chlamydiota bacterium]|nr:signal recognition particle protein [Chlamydiota bacterium]